MIKEQVLECGGSFGINNVCQSLSCARLATKTTRQDNLEQIPVCAVMKFSTQVSVRSITERVFAG